MSTRDEQFREQLSYREFLREEEKRQREQELIQAVAENLPADDSGGNRRALRNWMKTSLPSGQMSFGRSPRTLPPRRRNMPRGL